MTKPICIMGTDTDIGKTYVSCQILGYLVRYGFAVAGIKPLSAGVIKTKYGAINEDVYKLLAMSNIKLPFDLINPFSFDLAIAPHITAAKYNIELNTDTIVKQTKNIIKNKELTKCDYLLIEGAGGIMTPLNLQETYLDILVGLNFPIILVVGMKIGCLNHTLLTYQSLQMKKLNVLGFIANCVDKNMAYLKENIEFLTEKLDIPLLATIPYGGEIQITESFASIFLNLDD